MDSIDHKDNNDSIVWKKGYKGFKNDLTSRENNFQFEINKIYSHHDEPIELCNHGFHFCRNFHNVMDYYNITYNNNYRYCEIEYDSREGKTIHGEGYEYGKSVTSSFRIVRELTEKEIRELLKGRYEVWRDEVTKELHRDNDLPALIEYYKNGRVYREKWYSNGKLHRENDLPAYITYYNTDVNRIVDNNGVIESVCIEEWYVNGELHRENDLPAYIEYSDNNGVIGSKSLEIWYINGFLHRDNDLPTVIFYYENGTKKNEYWYINGKQHRENALPAYIEYRKNGSIEREEWWINGLQSK